MLTRAEAFLTSQGNCTGVLRRHPNDGSHAIQIRGSPEDTANIALQIAWILSTFRNPLGGRDKQAILALSSAVVAYCGIQKVSETGDDNESACHLFTFELQDLQPVKAEDVASCWNHMFRTLVVASGFPIPSRPNSLQPLRGIELPISLMVTLAQLDYSLPFLNSFVLKGLTAAAVPRFDNGSRKDKQYCVQWHLIQTCDNSDLSMECVVEKLGDLDVLAIKYADMESESDEKAAFKTKRNKVEFSFQSSVEPIVSENNRHFLGLYTNARVRLGTQESNIENIHGASGLRRPATRLVWTKTITTGVSSAIPHTPFGISISTSWSFARATAQYFERDTLLQTKITRASRRIALVYDTGRKIAWLVPEVSAILHLIKTCANDPNSGIETPLFPQDEDMIESQRCETVLNFVNTVRHFRLLRPVCR